jgi:hypothetical protein
MLRKQKDQNGMALHDRGAPYMVPTVATSYPDVLVLCPVVSCMTLVLTRDLSNLALDWAPEARNAWWLDYIPRECSFR